jgi:non-heme chloroperoxidase
MMPYIKAQDGTRLFVTDWGTGSPVVFTHAWALRSDQWNYQIPALVDAGLRCITYDRRGHGRSDCPSTGYDLDTLADDLASVIEQHELQGITLVGRSIGCREIVRYLSRHGDACVARAVLVGTNTPLLRRTEDNPDGWDPALIDANSAAVAADVPKWCADFERLGPYFGSSPGGSPGLVDWTIRLIVETPLQVLLVGGPLATQIDSDHMKLVGKIRHDSAEFPPGLWPTAEKQQQLARTAFHEVEPNTIHISVTVSEPWQPLD